MGSIKEPYFYSVVTASVGVQAETEQEAIFKVASALKKIENSKPENPKDFVSVSVGIEDVEIIDYIPRSSTDGPIKFIMTKYYEVINTVNEYNSVCSGMYVTEEQARERLKTCNDWYSAKGTGRIFEVIYWCDREGNVHEEKNLIYENC